MASTPARLGELLEAAGGNRASQPPAPGKWSIREILCHLADCETVFAFRLRQTLAEPGHVIQPFDQDLWAKNYAAYDAQSALALIEERGSHRRKNLALEFERLSESFLHEPVPAAARGASGRGQPHRGAHL